MPNRTDLALESLAAVREREGIEEQHRGKYFRITDIRITSDAAGAPLGKPKGRYITLEGQPLSRFSDDYEGMAQELAGELRPLLPKEGCVLVAGLGNADITPDALGPQTISGILATRHLRQELGEEEAFLRSLRPVAALAGGVLGQTGIESAELFLAVSRHIQPSAVIAVDALACSDLHRLGTTVQISDAGISPGSGVRNSRAELSAQTLGVPVIAVGIPTVVDLHTVVRQAGTAPPQDMPNLMVTPRDIDRLLHHAARLLALSINLALHPQLSYEDAEAL